MSVGFSQTMCNASYALQGGCSFGELMKIKIVTIQAQGKKAIQPNERILIKCDIQVKSAEKYFLAPIFLCNSNSFC